MKKFAVSINHTYASSMPVPKQAPSDVDIARTMSMKTDVVFPASWSHEKIIEHFSKIHTNVDRQLRRLIGDRSYQDESAN